MPHLDYDIVDVFTDRPFAGNALAVVHGAEGLSAEQMCAITREFNLSETTFPMPAADGGDYGVRIFTLGGEVPFAGHPTLGTAWVLQRQGRVGSGSLVQECGAGPVEVSLPEDPAGPVELAAPPRDLPVELGRAEYAEALGLDPSDVVGPVLAAGCGLTFVHVPVGTDALARAVCPRPADPVRTDVPGVSDPVAGVDVYAVAARNADVLGVDARVFCPGVAVAEDPATGSSAAGLGLALHARGLLPDSGRYVISQGVQMGRPSKLSGRVELAGEAVARCRVAGAVVHVASGRITVPT